MRKILGALAKRIGRKHKERCSLSVEIGGECIVVRPMGLEDALRFLLLIAPYVGALDRHLPMLAEALQEKDGPQRRGFLKAVVTAMTGEMERAPGDVTKAVAILLGKEPEWVARNALPEEIVRALSACDEANDFKSLFASLRALGLTMPKVDRGNDGPSR